MVLDPSHPPLCKSQLHRWMSCEGVCVCVCVCVCVHSSVCVDSNLFCVNTRLFWVKIPHQRHLAAQLHAQERKVADNTPRMAIQALHWLLDKVCIYICMYTYIYIYIHIYLYICINILYIDVRPACGRRLKLQCRCSACSSVPYIYIEICICMYVCIYMYVYINISKCIYNLLVCRGGVAGEKAITALQVRYLSAYIHIYTYLCI